MKVREWSEKLKYLKGIINKREEFSKAIALILELHAAVFPGRA